jgi:hypothetical protein
MVDAGLNVREGKAGLKTCYPGLSSFELFIDSPSTYSEVYAGT